MSTTELQTTLSAPSSIRNPHSVNPRPAGGRADVLTAAQAPDRRAVAIEVANSVRVYARAGLTEREVAVLRVWLDCDSKLTVAARLHIALGTVNTHLTRIRDKYAAVGRPASTKAALVARALQDGIVTLDDL